MLKSICLRNQRVDYSIRVSPSAKRARIKVTPKGVEVVLPADANKDRAELLFRENTDWVLDQLAFIERMGNLRIQHQQLEKGTIFLRGRKTHIKIVEEGSNRKYGLIDQEDSYLRVRVPQGHSVEPLQTLESWLRKQARKDIIKCLAERCVQMQVRFARLYIKNQRTRWGSCSRRKNLSFNWRLVMAPPEVLDYIVVHELAHLIEPYHSTKFWLVVRSYCPEFERYRAWLKSNEGWLKLPTVLDTNG
jgi:hypothetical protein